MILIADSGGSKTHWVSLVDGTIRQDHFSSGLNLSARNPEQVLDCLYRELPDELSRVREVHFYGAGLGVKERKDTMRELLERRFRAKIVVEHDLLGAARSLCGDLPGVACILGTGSNACLYDGKTITESRGGHGWILGDEGSGVDIGKHMLKAALEGGLPDELVEALKKQGGMEILSMRSHVYNGPQPNTFLAGLAKVAADHREHPWIKNLVQERFRMFLETTVKYWPGDSTVHFVGGIAKGFENELRAACLGLDVQAGKVDASPMDGLVEWVLRHHG